MKGKPKRKPTRPKAKCDICKASSTDVLFANQVAQILSSRLAARLGHVVVATQRHVTAFGELSQTELEGFMVLLASAARAAERAMPGFRYYVLRIGDKTAHLHFHLIPKTEKDPELGPYVFGQRGWAASIRAATDEAERNAFGTEFKRSLIDANA